MATSRGGSGGLNLLGGLAILLAACGGGGGGPTGKPGPGDSRPAPTATGSGERTFARPPGPPATAATFAATLSAATVAGDCPDAPSASDDSARSMPKPRAGDVSPSARARLAGCRQSEMTLRLELHGAASARLRIVGVQLMNMNGDAVGALTPRAPRSWDATTSSYVPWDEVLAEGEVRTVAYKLSAVLRSETQTYQLKVQTEAVLPDGTILPSSTAYLLDIAQEPHVVT